MKKAPDFGSEAGHVLSCKQRANPYYAESRRNVNRTRCGDWGSRAELKRKSRPARSWNLGAGLGHTVEGEIPCAYI